MTALLSSVTRAGSVGRDALWSLVLHGASLVITFVVGVALARLLGPTQYGTLAYVLALAGIASTALTFGMPNMLTRRLAMHSPRGEVREIRGTWRSAWRATTGGSIVFVIVVGAVAAASGPPGSLTPTLSWLGLLSIPLAAVVYTAGGALRGLGRGISSLIITNLLRPGAWLLILAALLLTRPESIDAQDALVAYVLAAAIALAVALLACRRALPTAPADARSYAPPGVWAEAVPFLIISVLAVMGTRLDLVLITNVLDAHAAGLYEVAARGAEMVLIPITATTVVLGPEFARRASADPQSLQRLATLAGWGLFVASLLIALPLALFAQPLATLVFGAEYRGSATALAILSVGYVLTMSMGPVHVILGMTGHSRASALGAVAALLVGATLSLLLMPRFGLTGAAAARALSQVATALWLAFIVQRRLGISAACWHR